MTFFLFYQLQELNYVAPLFCYDSKVMVDNCPCIFQTNVQVCHNVVGVGKSDCLSRVFMAQSTHEGHGEPVSLPNHTFTGSA